MKFKVEPKDFMLFVIYCVLLLYLCAIAVLNISSLSADGTFYGLLPFKAFTPDYIGATFNFIYYCNSGNFLYSFVLYF